MIPNTTMSIHLSHGFSHMRIDILTLIKQFFCKWSTIYY